MSIIERLYEPLPTRVIDRLSISVCITLLCIGNLLNHFQITNLKEALG